MEQLLSNMTPTKREVYLLKQLFSAGIIAIPIKMEGVDENGDQLPRLLPEPNFLVIDSLSGIREDFFPDQNGELVRIKGQNSTVRLVHREILEKEGHKDTQMREIDCDTSQTTIPLSLISILQSQEFLLSSKDTVNITLGMFKYRGVFKGYSLVFDTPRTENYILKSEEQKLEDIKEKEEREALERKRIELEEKQRQLQEEQNNLNTSI